jgi:hypothetical protein
VNVFEVFQVATTVFIRIVTASARVDFAAALSLLPFLLTGSGLRSRFGFGRSCVIFIAGAVVVL